jgi:hypothetical protein
MSNSSTCYTCLLSSPENLPVYLDGRQLASTVNVQLNDGRIPDWFKMAGVYSPLAPIFTRNPQYNWFVNNGLVEQSPAKISNSVTFKVSDLTRLLNIKNVDPTDTYVAYWATSGRNLNNPEISDAITAYGDFSNSGIAKANPDSSYVTLYYQTPKIYNVNGEVWPPHLHFTLLQRDKTWLLYPGAMDIYPQVTTTEVKHLLGNGKALLVNSLPGVSESNSTTIQGSVQIPDDSNPKTIRKILTGQLLNSDLTSLIGNQIPKATHIPICVFCLNSTCGSATRLLKKLRVMGYTNLMYYPGGIDEFNNR